MNRRQFLRASSAALILPAIVKAENLMRVQPLILPEQGLLSGYNFVGGNVVYIDNLETTSTDHDYWTLVDADGKAIQEVYLDIQYEVRKG